jgi:hydrogenase nickel incorporation protein HypA/HybF
MHEMSIARNIVEIVEDVVRDNGPARVERVVVSIGRMVGVVPDSLSFCFEAITADTPLSGASLIIEPIPIRARCNDCGLTFEVESFAFHCDACGGTSLDVLSGNELLVHSIEVQ